MPKVTLKCEYCNKEKEMFPSAAKRFRFCSRKCQGLHLRYTNNIVPIGKKNITHFGYIEIKTEKGWMLEHRYVMEQELGRKLTSEEEVHHIDGNKQNNDPSNLEIMSRKEHFKKHQEHLTKAWLEAKPWKQLKRDSKGRFLPKN